MANNVSIILLKLVFVMLLCYKNAFSKLRFDIRNCVFQCYLYTFKNHFIFCIVILIVRFCQIKKPVYKDIFFHLSKLINITLELEIIQLILLLSLMLSVHFRIHTDIKRNDTILLIMFPLVQD